MNLDRWMLLNVLIVNEALLVTSVSVRFLFPRRFSASSPLLILLSPRTLSSMTVPGTAHSLAVTSVTSPSRLTARVSIATLSSTAVPLLPPTPTNSTTSSSRALLFLFSYRFVDFFCDIFCFSNEGSIGMMDLSPM